MYLVQRAYDQILCKNDLDDSIRLEISKRATEAGIEMIIGQEVDITQKNLDSVRDVLKMYEQKSGWLIGLALASILFVSPLKDSLDRKIGQEIASVMRAVMSGRIIVGIIQGLVAYLGFIFFGVSNSILLAALVTIIAILPLIGPLFVIIPVALYQISFGFYLPAIGLILWGVFIVGLIDNIVGPILIESKTNLHPFLVLIAILGGFGLFGPVGFIAGPVLLGVVYALFRTFPLIYNEHKKNI